MISHIVSPLLSLLFPQQCKVCNSRDCDADTGICCGKCWSDSRIFTGNEMLCSKCGSYFNAEGGDIEVSCHKCGDHAYDKAFAAGIYEKGLAANLLALKSQPFIPKAVRHSIRDSITRRGLTEIDIIIPAPLSVKRRAERGFNQADLIADEAAAACGKPVDRNSLIRKIHTPIHRIAMDDKARALTVKNAFDVARPKLVEGKNILLVDDVFTSGATASACAAVLKKKGADKVMVFTAARAVLRSE